MIPSAIIVGALAVLQYRWSTRISEATAVRLADSLQMSMMNWQKDFFRYFSGIGVALRIDPVEDAPGDVGQYVRRFAEWKAVSKYPKLVSNYLLRSDATARPQALRGTIMAQCVTLALAGPKIRAPYSGNNLDRKGKVDSNPKSVSFATEPSDPLQPPTPCGRIRPQVTEKPSDLASRIHIQTALARPKRSYPPPPLYVH